MSASWRSSGPATTTRSPGSRRAAQTIAAQGSTPARGSPGPGGWARLTRARPWRSRGSSPAAIGHDDQQERPVPALESRRLEHSPQQGMHSGGHQHLARQRTSETLQCVAVPVGTGKSHFVEALARQRRLAPPVRGRRRQGGDAPDLTLTRSSAVRQPGELLSVRPETSLTIDTIQSRRAARRDPARSLDVHDHASRMGQPDLEEIEPSASRTLTAERRTTRGHAHGDVGTGTGGAAQGRRPQG